MTVIKHKFKQMCTSGEPCNNLSESYSTCSIDGHTCQFLSQNCCETFDRYDSELHDNPNLES